MLDKDGIILLDGAMGTEIIKRDLDPKADLNVERPDVIREIHRNYIESGSMAITTNTFSANRIYRDMAGIASDVARSNVEGARLARDAAAGSGVMVLGDIGPTGQFLEPYGEFCEDEFIKAYHAQAQALVEGGVHGFIIETMMDVREAACALRACLEIAKLPVFLSFSMNQTPGGARTIMGNTVEDVIALAEQFQVDAVGVNCAIPAVLQGAVAEFAAKTAIPILAQPNAGQPQTVDGKIRYDMSPEEFHSGLSQCLESGARVVGGCCGTTPEHILAAKALLGHSQ